MMNRQPNDRYRQPPYLAPVVEFFQLLADPARLGILVRLAKGERNVSGLRDELELPQPTVSHHLKLLRAAGLVARRRSGKFVLYRLEGRALTDPGGGSLRMSGEHCGIEIRLHMERSAP
jgi:ArsR family transcriptional regulator, zinc-responsive transcriptional repressor